MDDFESYTRQRIAELRSEAEALERNLKSYLAARGRLESSGKRSRGDQPRSGAFGVVLEAIDAAGPEGLSLDEMTAAAENAGYEVKRPTLRSQLWQAKGDGRVVPVSAGRYRSAVHDHFAGVKIDPPEQAPPRQNRELFSAPDDDPHEGGFSPGPRKAFTADLDEEIPF